MLAALAARPDLWNANDLRTTYPGSPHADVDDIWVMFDDPNGDVVNSLQTHPYPAWRELPIKDLVLNLMRRVGGTQLGRVIISRLAPGLSIAPHADQGAPAEFYQRYHLVLQSGPGCVTRSGGEVIQAAAGEVWWFDNRAEHEVINNGADDRIAVIIDIRVI
jgi:quercetin dioxygenase-like cupin family protein